MSYRVVYLPKALQEFEDAALWYLEKSKKASFNFYIAVNKKVNSIIANPTLYKKTKKEFRETSIRNYPFSIIFVIDNEQNNIVIISIFHNKRNPKTKFKTQ